MNYKNLRRNDFIFLILCVSIFFTDSHAQDIDKRKKDGISSRIFTEAFAYGSEDSGKGKIDVYIQVPYSEISFAKEDNLYIGRYEITANLKTRDDKLVWQKTQFAEVSLKDFAHTVSSRLSNIRQFSADVFVGKYNLILQITDSESKKSTTTNLQINLRDYSKDSLALSDIMLVHRISADNNRKNIVPNLTGIIGKEVNYFYLFFEVYQNKVQFDSIQFLCRFVNSKNETKSRYTKVAKTDSPRTQIVWRIDSLDISTDLYLIIVEAERYPRTSAYTGTRASVSRTCIIRTRNMPPNITDIDKATDQLIYIARGGEIDFIREAQTNEEKLQRFLSFWAKRDPDPKTPENELMEEYYNRVEYANKNFSAYFEGWKSDRGMVFIRFGAPQQVERRPFDANSKPYEIWYYYDLNREFIFVDETGFGDYRLRYPETDLWGRVR